ncbi:helix-turn-helix transcriptional regulator [Halogeometricum luteum]|uniref:Winged helix-turn-helix domain-containing protein n=1 Tax=Halogeometricum luteum TaxID=2950537 RepID=A0ABU2G1U1_9EURY|nr:winged helix-turn-helix domain-containing protein [Halogeometricum sp. S3BR5-2]MDS0294456.1 winged helix-turn-helix domain-containing protein [Halogeometricum sp. S3BR5-2]
MTGLGRSLEAVVTNREPILRALVRGPLNKPELTEAVDSSRSTVDRAIRELVDAGLVGRADGRYEATLAGRSALDAVEAFHDRMRGVESAAGVLSHLGPDAPIDPDFLVGADVYVATPEMPDGVVQRLFDSVEAATHLRGIAPVALSGHLNGFYEAARANDARVEMLIDAGVLDSLVATASTRETLLAQLRDDRVTILRGEIPFPFGLWLTESEAGVMIYSDTGVRGVIVNDTDDACAWAETWFERLSAEARTLTASGVAADD